jgi:hypothetical protein
VLRKPIIIKIETAQFINGKITQLKFLNTNQSVKIINKNTPSPKTKISFLIKVIMSSAIIGIPLNLISALDLYFSINSLMDLLYKLIFFDCSFCNFFNFIFNSSSVR